MLVPLLALETYLDRNAVVRRMIRTLTACSRPSPDIKLRTRADASKEPGKASGARIPALPDGRRPRGRHSRLPWCEARKGGEGSVEAGVIEFTVTVGDHPFEQAGHRLGRGQDEAIRAGCLGDETQVL